MQKISIVIIGESHRDPGPPSMLLQHIKPLRERNIALVSCTELPCDQTRAFKQQLDLLNFSVCELALRSELLKNLIHRDVEHLRPYFLASQLDDVLAVVPTLLKQIFAPNVANSLMPNVRKIAEYILYHLAIEANIKLDKALQDIPYQGLEQPTEIHDATGINIRSRPGFFETVEESRTKYMVDKILREAIAKAEGRDAVIICQVGILHAQRLAATIKHRIESQVKSCDIAVIPMLCLSNYVSDTAAGYIDDILKMQMGDATAIFDQYRSFSTPLITITENKNTLSFTSQEFDQVMALAVAHIAPNKVYCDPEIQAKTAAMLVENDIGVIPSPCPKICSGCTML